jgi:hypothetical protein
VVHGKVVPSDVVAQVILDDLFLHRSRVVSQKRKHRVLKNVSERVTIPRLVRNDLTILVLKFALGDAN